MKHDISNAISMAALSLPATSDQQQHRHGAGNHSRRASLLSQSSRRFRSTLSTSASRLVNHSHRSMHQRETRTAMRLAVVVVFFITCWLPFFVLYILKPFLPADLFPEGLYPILTWLGKSREGFVKGIFMHQLSSY